MCGRVVAATPRDYLAELFGAEPAAAEAGPPPSYNVAPTNVLYAVAATRHGRRLGAMRWGLVPTWADSPDEGPRPINARAESVLERRVFAEALEARRTCLVPVDGFYEWKTRPGGSKQPFLLTSPDGRPLALAGLWTRWTGRGHEPVVTFTIVTTPANDDVAPLHDRMPALVRPEDWDVWLNARDHQLDRLLDILRPAPAGSLTGRPASRRVNDVRNDDPALLVEEEPEEQAQLF